MNEEMMKMFLSGEVRIVFRKKTNGLIRELLGTLSKEYIPPEQYGVLSTILTNPGSDRAIIWDIEVNDWRSFYMNTVIDIFQSEKKRDLE